MGKRKTQEEFEKDVYDRLGDQYELLGPYPGAHGKVPMRHLVCGNTFEKNVHDIISKNSGCPYCNGAKPKLYNEDWVKDNTPLPYHYVSGYAGMKQKCQFYCDNCGVTFEQLPSRLINQKIYGCNCCPTKKLTHEEFLDTLGAECLKEYSILDTYINTDTKIHFKHETCGTIFELTPYSFIYRHNKKYCPICYFKKSHGETLIDTYLTKINIEYHRQFAFPDLPKRFFDFYLPEQRIAIEYDGKQHFEAIDFFGGEKRYNEQKIRDEEKNNYCLNNNITLLRIPYFEENNIFQILTEIFEEKSSTTIEKYKVIEQSTL